MGWREALSRQIWDEESEAKPEPPAPATSQLSGVGSGPARTTGLSPGVNAEIAPVDDETYRSLSEHVFDRDSSYARFTRTLAALASEVADESQRFRIALATLKANGTGPDEILRGIQLHVQELASEQIEFEQTAAAQEREAEQLGESTKALDGQIEQTRAALDALVEQRRGVAVDAAARKEKVTRIRTSFTTACTRISAAIERDRVRIAKEVKS